MIYENFPAAKTVVEKIEKAGFEAVFVGGAVRDYYLNKPQHDVDIATSALPEEVKAIFQKTVDVGIEHGTVLVLDEGEPIEVTTYRTEGTYSDSRRPDEVQFVRSLAEDLKRRDFTINAMAMRLNGELVDLYGGQLDLTHGVIRAVGVPAERFGEDALRMLRAVRFVAQLGFAIEAETLQAITIQSESITLIAKERIAAEMEKLFVSEHVAQGIHYLVESGLAEYLVGAFSEHEEHFGQFTASEAVVGWAFVAYLIDDVDAVVKFYRLSKKARQFMQQTVDATKQLTKEWTVLNSYHYEQKIIEVAFQFLEWTGSVPYYELTEILAEKRQLPIQSMQELAVTGHDLMNWAGGKGGPWLKVALDELLHAILRRNVANNVDSIKEWFEDDFNQR